jgi:hypothetical protein
MASPPPAATISWSGTPTAALVHHFDFNRDTPPPPPPKPSSGETSRRGTPLTPGPSVTYHPSSAAFQQPYTQDSTIHSLEEPSHAMYRDQVSQSSPVAEYKQAPPRPGDIQAQYGSRSSGGGPGIAGNSIPEPPGVEEGWLPDSVKDKSYDL